MSEGKRDPGKMQKLLHQGGNGQAESHCTLFFVEVDHVIRKLVSRSSLWSRCKLLLNPDKSQP